MVPVNRAGWGIIGRTSVLWSEEMKDLLLKMSVMAVSLAIGIVMCEVAIRYIEPQRLDFVRPIYDADEDLIFKLRKNHTSFYSQFEFNVEENTNSVGLRDREFGERDPESIRILGLGDSYAFGQGVSIEEAYIKQLEAGLQDSLSKKVETINAGVPAYGLVQEVRYLEKYGLGLDPDVVLVGFFIGNDIVDSYELFDSDGKATIGVRDNYLFTRKARDEDGGIRGLTAPLRYQLATGSHLYIFLRNRFSGLLTQLGLRNMGSITEFCELEYTPYMDAQWSHTQDLLMELDQICQDNEKRLVIALIPLIYQVHDDIWKEYVSILDIDESKYDMTKPQRLMLEFCAEKGIPCFDVLDPLREKGKDELLFFRVDGHLNAAGHRVMGRALTDYLTEFLAPDNDPAAAEMPSTSARK